MKEDAWHYPRENLAARTFNALVEGPAKALTLLKPKLKLSVFQLIHPTDRVQVTTPAHSQSPCPSPLPVLSRDTRPGRYESACRSCGFVVSGILPRARFVLSSRQGKEMKQFETNWNGWGQRIRTSTGGVRGILFTSVSH